MLVEIERMNSNLAKCLHSAFSMASVEKRTQLVRLLKKAAINIEDALRYPVKIPSYLLMIISKELGACQAICEIMMQHQLNRVIAR